MSLLFWRKTQDTGEYRPDGTAQTKDVVATVTDPIPVQIIQPEDNDALSVEIAKEAVVIYSPIDYEAITVAATAIGLDPTKYRNADRAVMTLETGQIRFRYDGAGNPTSTTGHVLDLAVALTLDGTATMQRFMAIRTGGTSGVLSVTYEKRGQ